jgi:predicted dehydrogenase
MNIVHTENVGNLHQSHSYVRGNWHNEAASTPMLLAKSCHDIDILQWLVGKPFARIQSFGSLSHFTAENRPEGAPDRCIEGCPYGESCYYNAVKLYLDDKDNAWFRCAATNMPVNPPDEAVEKALWESDYGKCVYACDNDVVDHQTVNIEFADGTVAVFTMSAFNKGGRGIQIMGTKGEIFANMQDKSIRVFDFATRAYTNEPIVSPVADESIIGGHGGGDDGIIRGFCDLVGGGVRSVSVCDGRVSAQNHIAVFAAEAARHSGTVVELSAYEKTL